MQLGITHYIVLAIGVLIGYAVGLLSGMPIGKKLETGNQATAIVKEVKKNVETKKKVNSLSNDELKHAYCHWVYDVPYEECLRTNIYVD